MSTILVVLFLLVSSLLFWLPVLANPSPVDDQNPSPFGFLKQLQGCRAGDNIDGIKKLKKYLQTFGYYSNLDTESDDYFNSRVEFSIKTYQLNHNLKVTGILDAETVSQMMKPRCGVPDIVNGRARMRSGMQMNRNGHSFLYSGSYYTFFPGSPRWPASKSQLTYAFLPGTRSDAMDSVAKAFEQWAGVTYFTFTQTDDYANADIKISFQRLDHGDGHAFDGPGGVLAHSFAPTDGRLHYDGDEKWAVGAVEGAFDLGSVGLHEIGHVLGLGHTSDGGAIMFPTMGSGVTKGFGNDDIQGIRALYNVTS